VLWVLNGELGLDLDGRTVTLAAGDTARLPAGTAYGWRVASEYARVLILAEPERASFYRDMSTLASDRVSAAGNAETSLADAARSLADAALKNGIELLVDSVRGV
jgi:hypothetical protein